MTFLSVFQRHQKWFGLVFLMIELNLFGGNILGFAALFDILPRYHVYSNLCPAPSNETQNQDDYVTCDPQTAKYQLALTLGIWFYNLLPFFLGPLINHFGCRFVRIISILFHIIAWICLGLVESDRDYLLFLHTVLQSISSIMIVMTAYVSCGYFSSYRALVSSLLSGASISSTMWFSIFQVLITNGRSNLQTLSLIWMALFVLVLFNSFFFMDWRFPFFNLPYSFATAAEANTETAGEEELVDEGSNLLWHQRIIQRVGVWRHLLSPMYISVVLFLSVLLLPAIFLPVTWYPWVYYVTNENTDLTNNYTLAFNLSTIAALLICPCSGTLLGFRADRSRAQKLFNISLMQTIVWSLAIILCVLRMFNTIDCVIAALVFNCLERSLLVGGSQAVIATFFPLKYIGTLTGVMWTTAAIISFIQYGLLPLVQDVAKSWRAWVIIVSLIVVMSCHLIQVWYFFFKARSDPPRTTSVSSPIGRKEQDKNVDRQDEGF